MFTYKRHINKDIIEIISFFCENDIKRRGHTIMKKKHITSFILSMLIILSASVVVMAAGKMDNHGLVIDINYQWFTICNNMETGVIVQSNTYEGTTINNKGLFLDIKDSSEGEVINETGAFLGLKLQLTDLQPIDFNTYDDAPFFSTLNHSNSSNYFSYNEGILNYQNGSYQFSSLLMPYNEDFSFTLQASEGKYLPSSIELIKNNIVLSEGTDYTYDAKSGKLIIKASAIDLPIIIKAIASDVPITEEQSPNVPVCAGSKDKNCDGVVTCDEEKGEGWTWNNKLKVCEYTGKTSYKVVNTAAR